MSTALSIRQLSKTYDNGFQALHGIDLDVAEGDFFALLGPNGAGKSTTIGILSTLARKSGGVVNVFGHDLDREPAALKRCLGVVPQEFNFNQFEKAFDIVVTQAGYYGIPARIARERAEHEATGDALPEGNAEPGVDQSGHAWVSVGACFMNSIAVQRESLSATPPHPRRQGVLMSGLLGSLKARGSHPQA